MGQERDDKAEGLEGMEIRAKCSWSSSVFKACLNMILFMLLLLKYGVLLPMPKSVTQ